MLHAEKQKDIEKLGMGLAGINTKAGSSGAKRAPPLPHACKNTNYRQPVTWTCVG